MLDAGVSITRVLQTVYKRGKFGRLFSRIEQEVLQGNSVADAVKLHKKQFQKLDVTLIEVGEQTGQLAEMFEELSQWYAFRQKINRVMRTGMILPLICIHMTSIIVPMVDFVRSGITNGFDLSILIYGMLKILALFYIPIAVILAVMFLTPKHGPLRRILDRFVMMVPVLGSAVQELELSRYSKVFAITYGAGVPIFQCVKMATDSVSNSVIRQKLAGAYLKVKGGGVMSAGFRKSLPGEFIALWQAGEESGDLDDSARRLGQMHAYNAELKFHAIGQWTPRIFYGIVAIVMIYYIFKIFSSIYGGLISI